MIRRNLTFAMMFAVVLSATAVLNAAPVFFLSTEPTPPATPSMLDLSNITPGSTGSFNIFANSDVRLSGVSLDIMEMGGGIKFTGVNVPNPDQRWFALDGPQTVTDSAIRSIGGAAIPGLNGQGIGGDSPQGMNVMLATVNYEAMANPGASDLQLKVGNNVIATWEGLPAQVHFGTAGSAAVDGGMVGAAGAAGRIEVGEVVGGVAPVAVDASLGERIRGAIISHLFTTSAGDTPITWSDLQVSGPGAPANAATLTADGNFSWNSHNSPFGSYTFTATATNAAGSDTGALTIDIVIPEPATLTLVGLAMVGLVGLVRRRS